MIGLNHILLFLAIVSPLAVLARAWRPGPTYRGWRIAALAVLIVAGISWLFFRSEAGYIAGGAWLALLFVPAVGLRRVADLAAHHRYKSARKLATTLQIFHPSDELRHQVQLLRTLEAQPNLAASSVWPSESAPDRRPRLQNAPAVIALIFLNVAAFLTELYFGEWADPEVLHRLGALEPYLVLQGEYWRLLTALFLHYDAVHLLFNLFALYVLGPPLERSIGATRFCACYLLSGLGSSAGVVILWRIGVINSLQLVGASGCVMGIVGAWAGFLLRHRHAPLAKRRLGNILMIVAIQTAFDLSTPQVSMSAHLCGLITGLFLGLIVSPRSAVASGR